MKASEILCVSGSICVLAGVFLFPVKSEAASVIYQFEPISSNLYPGSPTPEVQAVFEDEKPGAVQLTITSDLARGEFLTDLYFNFDPMDNINRLHFIPSGIRAQPLPGILAGANSFKAGGGYFDIRFAFGTTRKHRFFGDDTVSYLITEPGLNVSDFVFSDSVGIRGGATGPYYALARIQTGCGKSQWLAACSVTQPVPEPASLALLAAGGGLGWSVCSRCGTRRFMKSRFNPPKRPLRNV